MAVATSWTECLDDVFQDEILKAFIDITEFEKFAKSKRGLNLHEDDIKNIVENHDSSVEEQKMKMLNMWKDKSGAHATGRNIRNRVGVFKRGYDQKDFISLDGGRFRLYRNQSLCKRGHIYFGIQKNEVIGSYFCAIELQKENKVNLAELLNLSRLKRHVNIVSILHAGIYRGDLCDYIYIAMDLNWTYTVRKMLEKSKRQGIPFNEFISTSLATQLSKAVDFLHSQNIIHCDIKPENILLSDDMSHGKLTNLKFSKTISTTDDAIVQTNNDDAIEQTNGNIGTEGYRAQETYNINARITSKIDIFSAGITIVEILTNGKHPFGENPDLWTYNIKNAIYPDLSSLPVFDKPQVEYLCQRMMEFYPENRPTAREVFNEVHRFQTWSQLKMQHSTVDQSLDSASTALLQRSTAGEFLFQQSTAQQYSFGKANAIIFFNASDKYLYSYKPTTKKFSRMQKLSPGLDFTAVVLGKHIYTLRRKKMHRFDYNSNNYSRATLHEMASMIDDHIREPIAAVFKGSIYVCANYLNGKSVERYDVDENRWERKSDMNKEEIYTCLVATKDHIYCFGKGDSSERYDAGKNEWELIESLPSQSWFPLSAAVYKNLIYVTSYEESEGILCYNIQKNSWSYMDLSHQWPFCENGGSIFAVNEELYIYGTLDELGYAKAIYLFEPETEQLTLVEKFPVLNKGVCACLAVKLKEIP